MSRDYRAKRLAAEAGISYTEALRRSQAAPADRVRSPDRPPMTCNPDVAAIYDWLEANGVHELLPPDPKIVVQGGEITFTAFRWKDWQTSRWQVENEQYLGLDTPDVETRTVTLLVPVPEAVREAARAFTDDKDCRFTLIEQRLTSGGDDEGE